MEGIYLMMYEVIPRYNNGDGAKVLGFFVLHKFYDDAMNKTPSKKM